MTVRQNIVDLMVKMKKIDQAGLTQRDVLILWVVREHPGTHGQVVTGKVGLSARSSVQTNLRRLILLGYIRDDRAYAGRAVPNILHLTDKGEQFWKDLVS